MEPVAAYFVGSFFLSGLGRVLLCLSWGTGKGIPGVHVLQSCLMHSPVLFFYCVSISDIYGLLVSGVGQSNLNVRAASLWFKVPEAIYKLFIAMPNLLLNTDVLNNIACIIYKLSITMSN